MSDPQATIEALRASGGWRADPARFRTLEALARRIPGQQEPVQRLLQARLAAAVAAYVERVAQLAPPPAPAPRLATQSGAGGTPLAQLVGALREARPAIPGDDELASVRRFRRSWEAQRTLDKLELAVANRPAQAGPLNSHALVLQSLELMRTLSPQYLRHFVQQVETLQWLEAAGVALPSEKAKPKKAAQSARPRKKQPPGQPGAGPRR